MVFDKMHHAMRLDAGIMSVDGITWGAFTDTISSNGWADLSITGSRSREMSNDVKMYAAGYIEGLLTCVRMSQYYSNIFELVKMSESSMHSINLVKALFNNEIAYMQEKANLVTHIMTEQPETSYWKHSRYIFFQLWGMCDGYNFAAKHFNIHTLGFMDLLLINSGAEMPALMKAYTPQAVSDRIAATATTLSFLQKTRAKAASGDLGLFAGERFGKGFTGYNASSYPHAAGAKLNATDANPLSDANWEKRLAFDGHCSAFIRVTDGKADMLTGHTTWNDYSTMMRIYKYYDFALEGCDTFANKIGMSSYPGVISSPDSYYFMDSGLTVMDTSLELLDPFIYEKVVDFPAVAHLPGFMHVMITNRMARTAAHWARLYDTINIGTYNSQWMILDYNMFKAGEQIRDNTLWVVETMPGLTHQADVSHFLRDFGYWPSMNRPYFNVIRDAAGHTAAQRGNGDLYSWNNCVRCKIFHTQAPAVNSLFEMRGLMNRNLFPLEGMGEPVEPGHSISARNDLSPQQKIPNGGIDAKIANRCLFNSMQLQAESGPTHANQPPFKWTDGGGHELWPGYPHVGLPDVWAFGWQQITPTGITSPTDVATC